jgi:hypothetical protein
VVTLVRRRKQHRIGRHGQKRGLVTSRDGEGGAAKVLESDGLRGGRQISAVEAVRIV